MPAPVIQFKRGAWEDLPGLAVGEPGFTTDTSDLYIGTNGTNFGNKFFGSGRYWRRESTGSGGGVNFYESPDNGDNFIGLRAPLNVPDTIRYYLPPSPIPGKVLQTDIDGNLSWSNQIDDANFSGQIEIGGDVNIDGNLLLTGVAGTSAVFNTDIFDTQARIFNVGLSSYLPRASRFPPYDKSTEWDLAVFFNYFRNDVRYRSGLFWDNSNSRIGIVSNVTHIIGEFSSTEGSPTVDTTSISWAPVEIGSLWINDCAGQSQVITCSGAERTLENISIDGGFY